MQPCALFGVCTDEDDACDEDTALVLSTLHALARRASLTQRLATSGRLARWTPPAKPKSMLESIAASATNTDGKHVHLLWLQAAQQLRQCARDGELEYRDCVDPQSYRDTTTLQQVLRVVRPLAPNPTHARSTPFSLAEANAQFAELFCGGGDDCDDRAAGSLLDAQLVEQPLHCIVQAFARREPSQKSVSDAPPYAVDWAAVRGEPTATAHAQRLHLAAAEDALEERTRTIPRLAGFSAAPSDDDDDDDDDGAPAVDAAAVRFAREKARELRRELCALSARDSRRAKRARLALAKLCNSDCDTDETRDCKSYVKWFAFAAGTAERQGLGCALRRAAEDGAHDGATSTRRSSFACAVALLEGRCSHARRCEVQAAQLVQRCDRCLSLLLDRDDDDQQQQQRGVVAWAEIFLEAEVLAEQLWEKRHHFRKVQGSEYVYDARLLLVEHSLGVQLRASQVLAADELSSGASQGRSSLRQMIMGSGKTTVLMPTLVALLADGTRLVTAVVPAALVVSTRQRPHQRERGYSRGVLRDGFFLSKKKKKRVCVCVGDGGVYEALCVDDREGVVESMPRVFCDTRVSFEKSLEFTSRKRPHIFLIEKRLRFYMRERDALNLSRP